MNQIHAGLFTFLGFLLFFTPAWNPAEFVRTGPDGTCASALWLGLMGLVLHAIGTGWLLADALRRVRAAVESFDPELPWFDATEVSWGMPVSLYALGAWETNDLPAGA